MIDFIGAEKSFKEYLKNYDLNDGMIKLKIKHTYEVVKKSEYIAKALNLEKEDIELAKIIGLLHDIGRFEQAKRTNDFSDLKGFNHANYGVKILFEEKMIRKFITTDKYDKIIKKAIYNHNKYKIEDGLNEKELLHSKIIRDADKLDNFRVKETENFEYMFHNLYNSKTINYDTISDKVYEDFMNHKSIKSEDRKTQIDFWICCIAFIFDLNFDVSIQYTKEHNYIDILVDRIEYKNTETKEKMEKIRQCAKDYLDGKKPIRKAVRCYLIQDNKVIAIKYKNENKKAEYYDIPGGKIESNEMPYQTAIREVKEETGIKITNLYHKGNMKIEYPNNIFDFEIFICKEYKDNLKDCNDNTTELINIEDLLKKKKILASIILLDRFFIKGLIDDNYKFNMNITVDEDEKILNIKYNLEDKCS